MATETETLCKLYLELANIVPETCVSSREFALRVDLSAETDAGKHWKDRAIAAEAREARLREALEHGADAFEKFLGDIGHSQDSYQRDVINDMRAALEQKP